MATLLCAVILFPFQMVLRMKVTPLGLVNCPCIACIAAEPFWPYSAACIATLLVNVATLYV